MENKLYWIWLSLSFSVGSDKPNEILSVFETPEEFYNLDAREMFKLGFLNEKDVNSLKGTSLQRAQKVIDDCEKSEIQIVTMNQPLYPQRLRMIYGPPIVLYYKGDIEGIDDTVALAVVGTRDPIEYGMEVTQSLCESLARAGAIIISGCAVGIDAAAHFGALKGKGRTIGVLGCGLDVDYPAPNKVLKQEILRRGGGLISELPPKSGVTGRYFPVRNRIIAGLSLGVLLTQSPVRSGSLITAEHALEQGKEIYCVPPHNIFDTECMGVMKYIRDGSTVISSAEDILMDFYIPYSDKLKKDKIIGDYITQKRMDARPPKAIITKSVAQESPIVLTAEEQADRVLTIRESYKSISESFDENQQMVYNNLDLTPKFIDELSVECGINVGTVLSILTELELFEVAVSYNGRRYGLKNNM